MQHLHRHRRVLVAAALAGFLLALLIVSFAEGAIVTTGVAMRLLQGMILLVAPAAAWYAIRGSRVLAELRALLEEALARSKQAEEESRLQAERAEAMRRQIANLIEHAPLAIAVVDREYRVNLWNPAAEELFGWKREEVLGKPMPTIPPGQHEQVANWVIGRLERGIPVRSVELARLRADGTTVDIEMSATCLRDAEGRIEQIVGFMHDLESRKAAELERLRLEAMIQSSPDYIAVAHGERVLFINRAGRELVGLDPDEDVTHLSVFDLQFDVDRIHPALDEKGTWSGEARLRHQKTGEPIPVEQHCFVVYRDGVPIANATTARTNKERKELEAQLLQAQKMEAVGRLAGGVAHDFNNLLTVIKSCSDLLAEELPADHPLHADVEQIQWAADRAAGLTRQLLAFSRRQVSQPQPLDLALVAEGARKLLQRLIGEDIVIDTEWEPGQTVVEADPGLIEQILINLAVNARDAMPGGGTLRIRVDRVERSRPGEDASAVEPFARLVVEDTGVGMDEPTRQRIFEPFFTTKEAGKGTGLGLSTVYGIVAQSRGFIEVQSAPGAGTRFEIYLPLLTEPIDEKDHEREEELPGQRAHVLVVEDEEAVRRLVVRVLRSAGHTVYEAASGDEALRMLDELPQLDLVVSDVVMPGMGGPALLKSLIQRRSGLRFLLMSGYTSDALERHKAVALNVPLIEKPFSPQELTGRIRAALDAPPPELAA